MARPEFEHVLDEQLGELGGDSDRIARINQINSQIAQLQAQISELQGQLQRETEDMVGALAVSVRQNMPGVTVSLDGGKCNVMHLSHHLSLKPNIASGLWDVEPNITGRRFSKYYGHALGLQHDVSPLVDGVSNFFKKRYKRLNPPTKNYPLPIANKGMSKGVGGYYA